MHLNYTKGIDWVWDMIDVATHFGYIDDSVQGLFKLIDPETGEITCDSDGNPIKIRGRKNLLTYFREHIKESKDLYDKLYKRISEREDPFIKSFEELLNVDINEKLGIDENTNLEEV